MGVQHETEDGRTIAVMQPYFIPYAGYFRLLAASDIFVIYDCVQFARRGWLHRNRLHDAAGKVDWLTLPLKKAPQETLIKDLAFRADVKSAFLEQARRFPVLHAALMTPDSEISQMLLDFSGTPIDYIVRLLQWVALQLGLPWKTVRSSTLDIDPALRGQERILAIIAQLGASTYVNAPGGVELYDPSVFADRGVDLLFLPPYAGNNNSIIERMITENVTDIKSEIIAHLSLQ